MPAIKFYQSGKERLVWSPERNKAIAEFLGGEFETDDPDVQKQLLALGYQPMEKAAQAFQTTGMERPIGKIPVPSTEVGGAAPAEGSEPAAEKVRKKTVFAAEGEEPSSGAGPRPAPAKKAAVASSKKRVQD